MPNDTGEVLGTMSHTTKELSTADFKDYIERVRRFASVSLDLDIPDPENKSYYEIK